MAIRIRSVLKNWFKTGDKPTEDQFADWIDSFYHKSEDTITDGTAAVASHVAQSNPHAQYLLIANIVDNLASTLANTSLSANQGRVLKGLVDTMQTNLDSINLMLSSAADIDNVVNKVAEVLAIFTSYPEGLDLYNELQNRYTKTEADNKFLTAIKTGGAYYQQNKILLQNDTEIVKIPQMNKVYLFEDSGATSVAMNLAWATANNLHTEDIFIFENRRTTGDVTITADGSQVYFYIDGSDQFITLKPKQAAMLYRWSTTAYLGYSVFLNKETSAGGGGGGIPEPTGANVPYGRLINGTWTEVMAKPLETTINQNSAITIADFTTEEKAINGFSKTWKIVGDSVNPLTLPATWLQKNTLLFDNTIVNYIVAEVVNGAVLYEIHNTNVNGADTQAPVILGVTTNTNGSRILVTFDEIVQGTPNFTYSAGSIATQTLFGSVAELTPTSPLIQGTSLGTLSGGDQVTDINNNAVTPLSNRPISNIILPNMKSLVGNTSIVSSAASKLQLATGAGGTDSPFTVSMWVYVQSTTAQKVFLILSHSLIWIDNNRRVGCNIYNGSVYIAKQSSIQMSLGWNYITISVGSSKTAAGINIYINNVLSNGSSGTGGTYTGGAVNNAITIGTAGLEHLIDEIVVWNQVLSTTDRNNTYASGQVVDMRSRALYVANNNNMLFYAKFDDSLVDLSPNPVTLSGTAVYSSNIP